MQNELEQKIRKAIPELKELGIGCEISGVDGDFHQFGENAIVLNHRIETDYTRTDLLQCYSTDFCYPRFFKTKIKYDTYNVSIIGKPIQLNHVLEYALKTKYEDGVNMMYEYEQNELLRKLIINNWNLKSNLLSDQSEELIKFINEL